MRRAWICAAATTLAALSTLPACGAAGPAPRLAAATPGPERRATIRYEIRGRPFPLPLVSGTIAGHPTWMILDTGASSHVIAAWFAKKHALPLKSLGNVGVDHVGKPLTAYLVDTPSMAIDEWGPLSETTVLATELPAALERLGIGAFVSPQWLDGGGGAVVLDLPRGELRTSTWNEARTRFEAGNVVLAEPGRARLCQDEGPVRGLAYLLLTEVEHYPADLLIDTGSQRTDLFLTSQTGQKIAARGSTGGEPIYTASGKIPGRQVRGAVLTSGMVATRIDVNLVEGAADASCPRDGVVGMDVLHACTLVFTHLKEQPTMVAHCDQPSRR